MLVEKRMMSLDEIERIIAGNWKRPLREAGYATKRTGATWDNLSKTES